jgi:hypothetical protein
LVAAWPGLSEGACMKILGVVREEARAEEVDR